MDTLLTRDDFRESVFKRDGHACVICKQPAVDAHHILERRLWPDGGYYLNNGASVCREHHLACERTDISVEDIRFVAGITKAVYPPHMYDDQVYDKWGNIILSNGRRLRGELFDDESVQKIIADKLPLFSPYVKYPRTYHLPWSENMTSDDRMIPDMSPFIGQQVVVTEKLDGENTTMYRDYIHARSVDGPSHPSRDWIKNFHRGFAYEIPDGWRISCENLYAKHSIKYENLKSYCYGFSMWDAKNICLSWDETIVWFEMLGIEPVPELYRGLYDEREIRACQGNWEESEGYVLRLAGEFHYSKFKSSVAKFVRKDHILTVKHWMYGQPIERNGLACSD